MKNHHVQSDDSADITLVEVEPISGFVPSQPLKFDGQQRGVLNDLLQLAIRGAMVGNKLLMTGDTYRMVVSPEMQKALRSGKAVLDRSGRGLTGIIRDKRTGRFIGKADFAPAQVAKFANVVGIAWEVAAMVTSQHYLTEISGKLDDISGQVREVSRFMEDQAVAELLGSLQSLRRAQALLASGSLTDQERSLVNASVEAAFRAAEAQVEHRLIAITRLKQEAPAYDQATLSKKLEQIGGNMKPLALALTTMIQATAVSAAGDWSQGLADGYRRSALEAFNRVRVSLAEVQQLPLSPTARTELATVRRVPWVLQGPKRIADEVGYRIDGRRQAQQRQRQERNQQALEVHVLPAVTFIMELNTMLESPPPPSALSNETPLPLALVARVDAQGQVLEVYLDAPQESV